MNELESYFESNPTFAREILGAFINNLVELRGSLIEAVNADNPAIFLSARHKAKTTIGFTKNEKLGEHIENIYSQLKEKGTTTSIDTRTLNLFGRLCNQSIQELEERLKKFSF